MIQTQRQVISAAIQHTRCLDLLLEHENVFTDNDCSLAYSAIKSMYEDNKSIDLPSLVAYCEMEGKPLNMPFVAEIAQIVPSFNFNFLFEQLLKKHKKRKIQDVAKDLYHAKSESDYDKFLEELLTIRDAAAVDDRFYTPKKMTEGNLDTIFDKSNYVKTGIGAVDEKLVGLFDGQVIVIAARPGKGKTTAALQILKNINQPTFFLSGEMSKKEIYAKLLSNMAEVETWKIEAKKLQADETERLIKTHEWYKEHLKMSVYDGAFSVAKIKSLIRKHQDRRVFVVDYLQIISGGSGNSEHLRIADISRGIKQLAQEIRKPIILLSQMTRDIEKQNREPTLSDLRESGAIEADADVVMFLHENKDWWYPIIAKNRKGPTGSIKNISFVKKYCRICDTELNTSQHFKELIS